MGRLLLVFGAVLLSGQTPAPPEPPPCVLKIGVAIGCIGDVDRGPENAAGAYQVFGLSKSRIMQDYAKDYLTGFGCTRFIGSGAGMHIKEMVTLKVATASGYVIVRQVDVNAESGSGQFWVAEPYFAGPCPEWTKADLRTAIH